MPGKSPDVLPRAEWRLLCLVWMTQDPPVESHDIVMLTVTSLVPLPVVSSSDPRSSTFRFSGRMMSALGTFCQESDSRHPRMSFDDFHEAAGIGSVDWALFPKLSKISAYHFR